MIYIYVVSLYKFKKSLLGITHDINEIVFVTFIPIAMMHPAMICKYTEVTIAKSISATL
jgi:hypothetical protein